MKIELVTIQKTPTSTHVKVLADNKDVGVLYLANDELDALLDLIRNGISRSDTEFVNGLNIDDGEEDLDD
jgi:hypothetical protein